MNNKLPLLTLGSIYATKTSGTEQTTETNNSNETKQGQEFHLAGGKPVGYLEASSTIRDESRGVRLVLEMWAPATLVETG